MLYLLLFQYKHPELEQRIHERLLRLFRQKVLQQYRVPASVSPEEFENLLLFLTAGFYSVYKRWILDDNSDSTLITKQLEQLSELCLMHTLQPRT